MSYKFHKLAELFPSIEGPAFKELVLDIKTNGLIQPIVLYKGEILDGRNRYRACLEAGVEPTFDTYNGSDPIKFVVSRNIHRRHLTAIELAALANTIANIALGDNQHTKRGSANWPTQKISQEEAAKMTGASPRTMRRLKSIKKIDEETHDKVVAKKISQKEADKIIGEKVKQEKAAKIEALKQEVDKKEAKPEPIPEKVIQKPEPKALGATRAENDRLKLRISELEEKLAAHMDLLEDIYRHLIGAVEGKVRFAHTYGMGGIAERLVFTREDYVAISKALHPDKVSRTGDAELIKEHQVAFDLFQQKKAMLLKRPKIANKDAYKPPKTAAEMLSALTSDKNARKDAARYAERVKFLFPSAIAEQIIQRVKIEEYEDVEDAFLKGMERA